MKTIREIAEEIGVTKQAIYYRIGRPPLSTALKFYVSKIDNVLTVSLDGEKLIKQAFGIVDSVKEMSKRTANFDSEFVKFLQEQLKIKDKQIADLTAINKLCVENATPKSRKRKLNHKPIKIKSGAVRHLMGNRGK